MLIFILFLLITPFHVIALSGDRESGAGMAVHDGEFVDSLYNDKCGHEVPLEGSDSQKPLCGTSLKLDAIPKAGNMDTCGLVPQSTLFQAHTRPRLGDLTLRAIQFILSRVLALLPSSIDINTAVLKPQDRFGFMCFGNYQTVVDQHPSYDTCSTKYFRNRTECFPAIMKNEVEYCMDKVAESVQKCGFHNCFACKGQERPRGKDIPRIIEIKLSPRSEEMQKRKELGRSCDIKCFDHRVVEP